MQAEMPSSEYLPAPHSAQEGELAAAEILPAAQLLHELDPEVLYWPAEHSAHESVAVRANLPAAQERHVSAPPVPSPFLPAVHDEQAAVLPSEYFPTSQSEHCVEPLLSSDILPAPHTAHDACATTPV